MTADYFTDDDYASDWTVTPKTYRCESCGIETTPTNRLRFLTEYECWGCYLIRSRRRQEALLLAAKLVATAEPGPARDVLMGMLRRI